MKMVTKEAKENHPVGELHELQQSDADDTDKQVTYASDIF